MNEMEKEKMNVVEFVKTVSKMPVEAQNEFFEKLRTELSEEDWNTTVQFISLFGLLTNPAKYKAVRTAICEELFGMEVPFSVKTQMEL